MSMCKAPYTGTAYTVEIDPPAPDTACECGGCEWTGTFAELDDIQDCMLSPGDPSPAGRCPDCDTLAYIVKGGLTMFNVSYRRVGGLRFLKLGRLTLSWSVCREYRPLRGAR